MCALMSEILESVRQTVQKQFTYRKYILTQKTMCRMHIHIVSTHSVLLDILAVINTHYTQNIHILHYVHLYTQWYAKIIIIIIIIIIKQIIIIIIHNSVAIIKALF